MEIEIIGNKKISLTPLNARILELDLMNCSSPVEKREFYEDKEFGEIFETKTILELNFYNSYSIKIKDTFILKDVKYTVNEIIPYEINKYLLIDAALTKTSQFLLPTIATPGSTASSYLYNSCFYNAYIKWDKYPEYNDGFIFLCYKFYNIEGYKQLEVKLTSQSNFIKTVEPNEHFTVFIMELPEKYRKVKNAIMEGKYFHGLSTTYKSDILKFYGMTDLTNPVYKALYKLPKAVKELEDSLGIKVDSGMEILSIPDINKETCWL